MENNYKFSKEEAVWYNNKIAKIIDYLGVNGNNQHLYLIITVDCRYFTALEEELRSYIG